MGPDHSFTGRAVTRIEFLIVFLGIAGTTVAALHGGGPWALGFLLGAAAAWMSFRWTKKVVNALGEPAGVPPKKRFAVILGLRYLLLAAGGYVILNYSALSLAAALFGLFVPVAAVILEILFELTYART
jgi:ATP synthase I chain